MFRYALCGFGITRTNEEQVLLEGVGSERLRVERGIYPVHANLGVFEPLDFIVRLAALAAKLRLHSRLTVEGARPSNAAIDRIERPATTPREISSRSDSVNASLERLLRGGRIPPVSERIR